MLNLSVYIFHFNLGNRFSWDATNLSWDEFTLGSDTTSQSCITWNSWTRSGELEIHSEQMTKKKYSKKKRSVFVVHLNTRNWVDKRCFTVQGIILSSYVCVCVCQFKKFLVSFIFLTDLCGLERERGTEVISSALHMTTSHQGPRRPRIFVYPLLIRDFVSQLLASSCTPDMAFPVKSRHGLLFSSLRLTLWLNRIKEMPADKLDFSRACGLKEQR